MGERSGRDGWRLEREEESLIKKRERRGERVGGFARKIGNYTC